MTRRRTFQQGAFTCALTIQRCQAQIANGRGICARRTFRSPFCLQHARIVLGIVPGPSTIPGAGCGLFASRDLPTGYVLGPYTGDRFSSISDLQRHRSGEQTVYSIRPHHSLTVDSSCHRSFAAYINQGTPTNCRLGGFTIPRDGGGGAFGPADPISGLCKVRSGSVFHRRGWRYIHREVLRAFRGQSWPWAFTTRPVPVGSELFVNYHTSSHYSKIVHSTTPMCC